MLYLQQGELIRLRALRTRKEIPDHLLSKVIGCDLSESAIASFKQNLKFNGLG